MRLSLSISLFNALPPVQERHRNDDNSVNDSSASLGICTTDNIDCRSVIKVTPAIVLRNVPPAIQNPGATRKVDSQTRPAVATVHLYPCPAQLESSNEAARFALPQKPVAICYLPFAITSFWLLNSSF